MVVVGMSGLKRWWCVFVVSVCRRIPAYQHSYRLVWNSQDSNQYMIKMSRQWCYPHTGVRILGERLFWEFVDECTPSETFDMFGEVAP